MFKNIVPTDTYTTNVVIKKKSESGEIYEVASFYGDYIMGQINSDHIKSVKTTYDNIKRVKTIVLEV